MTDHKQTDEAAARCNWELFLCSGNNKEETNQLISATQVMQAVKITSGALSSLHLLQRGDWRTRELHQPFVTSSVQICNSESAV